MAASHLSSPDDTDRPPARVQIGLITTTHGVRGLVKIRVDVEDETLLNGDIFTAQTGSKTLRITLKNRANKVWLAAIDGYNDKTASEALRGTKLYAERSALADPDDDEFYYVDLIGRAVQDADGQSIGEVIAVENFGASDLLEIQPKSGTAFYLPFTDECVLDIQDDIIMINIPEGLRE